MDKIQETKTQESESIPDYIVMPKDGAIVRKGYYDRRSYAAGYRIPYPQDYAELFHKLIKKLSGRKGKEIDFNDYFTPISIQDYFDPQYYTGTSITKAPLPPEKIAPERSMIEFDEVYSEIKLLESDWLGLKVVKVKDPLEVTKIIYISNGGFAIISQDIDAYLKGIVPEECYLIDGAQNSNGFASLDARYYDGEHEDFLMNYYNVVLNRLYELKEIIDASSPDFSFIIQNEIEAVQMALSNGRLNAQKHMQ